MKALTNILTRLLMLMLLMLVACTEETVEVNNLVRKEQYVMVRMQVPGMTAATTRAADDVIESVTALAFDTNGNLLEVVSATNITTEGFNLAVPNGTKNIHFLANYNGDLSAVQKESDLTTLTTTDYNNLVYWGMATYDGSNSTLSTTFYRNVAKISIKPSVEDVKFNQFTQEQLIIMGLDNPNTSGTLIPYNNGFHNTGVAPTYLTLPNDVTTLDKTPVGNEGAGYGYSLYVFEHANSSYMDKGLFVICKIGNDFYKVALTSDGKNPYQIIRNHEYIIYVSDVDDYAHDNNYCASSYNDAFDKKPINLEVKEVAQVAFSNTNDKTIDWNNGNPNSFNVEMSNITEGTVTLTIAAEGFQVTQGGNELQIVEGNYTYTGGNTTFTFKPTAIGSHQITITGSGQYATVPSTTINVTVQASIKVDSATPTQLYYDSNEEQTVTVNVTIPTGVETLNISAADFIFDEEESGSYTYAVNRQTSAALSFKLKSGIQEAKTSTITISDANDNATQASVSIDLVKTPVVTFSPDESSKTMSINETYTVTMNVPNGGTLTSLNIAAEGFTVASSSVGLNDPVDNIYSYAGGTTTFTFTPTSAGSRTIRFYSGEGVNINVPEKNISVAVNATIIAEADKETIYHDGNDKTVTVSVTIPKGVSGLEINADDFSVALQDGNGTLIDNTYTPNDTNGQTAVFVFTYTGESTSGTSIIEISDKDNSEYVDDAEVGISVTNKPVAGANTELLEEGEVIEFSTTNDSNCMLLKSNNNETGDAIAASYKSKFTKGTRLSVNFNCVVIQYGRNPALKLSSIWGTTFATYQYKAEEALEQTLIYEFTASDIETINNAGLQLVGNNVTITQITIIPASTTE